MRCNNSVYGNYRTRKFREIFDSNTAFVEAYTNSGMPKVLTDENLNTLYLLLFARYGNSSIASSDEQQFKYKVYSTIYMYGPAWQKRLEVQQKLIELSDDEIVKGTTAIHNNAINPGQMPTTQTLEELNYINQQNTTKYKKSKIEGYATLYALIETDVTEEFIGKFKKLFITVVAPQEPLWYATEEEEE